MGSRETLVTFLASLPSSVVLILVLGGLLLCGLFCSVESRGVGTAELASMAKLGVEGAVPVEAGYPLVLFVEAEVGGTASHAEISRSSAVF